MEQLLNSEHPAQIGINLTGVERVRNLVDMRDGIKRCVADMTGFDPANIIVLQSHSEYPGSQGFILAEVQMPGEADDPQGLQRKVYSAIEAAVLSWAPTQKLQCVAIWRARGARQVAQ